LAQTTVFAAMGMFQVNILNLASRDSKPESYTGAITDAGFFSALGIAPLLGRVFTDEETQPGNDAVVVLSHAFCQQRCGGDRGLFGRTLDLNFPLAHGNREVMPPGFEYPPQAAMLVRLIRWTPQPEPAGIYTSFE